MTKSRGMEVLTQLADLSFRGGAWTCVAQILLGGRLEVLNTDLCQVGLCSLRHLSSLCSFSDQNFIFKISVIFHMDKKSGNSMFYGRWSKTFFLLCLSSVGFS